MSRFPFYGDEERKEEILEVSEIRILKEIEEDIDKTNELLTEIRDDFRSFGMHVLRFINVIPSSMELSFVPESIDLNIKGDITMSSVAFTLSPLTIMLGTPVEKNADGSVFTFDPTKIVWSVQDSTIVSFVQNADGTATFTPLAVGQTMVGCVDSATQLSATAQATVTQGTTVGPTSMELTFTPAPSVAHLIASTPK